jgi:UDP-glucose 4-epimerase
MAELISHELGVVPELQIEPSRVGEVTYYIANIGKARTILDYTPQTPLKEGISKSVSWCLDWWSNHS